MANTAGPTPQQTAEAAEPLVEVHRAALAGAPAQTFRVGDQVTRGWGRKVMTIASFSAGIGVNAGQVFAKLEGGTIYDIRGLRLAKPST